MTLRFLLIAATLAIGCDKPLPPDPPDPVPVVVTVATHPKPVSIAGELMGSPGPALTWSHAINAANIDEIAVCQDRLYALSEGRIVEWDTQALIPKHVLVDFGAVSSIDAVHDVLFAGTIDGRLLRSYCDGSELELTPDPHLEVLAVRADTRSRTTRGLVAYREPPSPDNGFDSVHVVVAHVDFDTGRALREPFVRPTRESDSASLFVDYRGGFYLSVGTPGQRSTAWSLEQFDAAQQPIASLADVDLRGFAQLQRNIWAYGGATDGGSSRIFRVDTNRARAMWDGREAWFGAPPGGEFPAEPINAMVQRKQDVLIVAGDGAFRADAELRRSSRLLADDPKPEVLRDTTRLLAIGDKHVVGTRDGIVTFGEREWRRSTVAQHAEMPPQLVQLTKEATWRGEQWQADPKSGVRVNATKLAVGPKSRVHGVYAAGASAVWVFADDGLWRLTGKSAKDVARWDTAHAGFHARTVRDVASKDNDLWLNLHSGATIHLTVATNE